MPDDTTPTWLDLYDWRMRVAAIYREKDYERRVQTSETLIEVAAARLVLRRLAGHMTARAP
jgi:hypothetical protein